MDHISVILSIISLAMGVAATLAVWQQYKLHRFPRVKDFFLYILLDTIYGGILFSYYYVIINIIDVPQKVTFILALAVPFIPIASVYFILRFGKAILKPKIFKALHMSFVVLFGIVGASLCLSIFLVVADLPLFSIDFSETIKEAAQSLFDLVFFTLMLYSALQKTDPRQKQASVWLSGFYLFIVIVSTSLRLFYEGAQTGEAISRASYFILAISISVFILFYFRKFVSNFFLRQEPDVIVTSRFDEAVLEYSISKREQDVIELVCRGKSTKEIATELFISAWTVKDHINTIYKKTKVGNRVSLTNLFTKPDSAQ